MQPCCGRGNKFVKKTHVEFFGQLLIRLSLIVCRAYEWKININVDNIWQNSNFVQVLLISFKLPSSIRAMQKVSIQ